MQPTTGFESHWDNGVFRSFDPDRCRGVAVQHPLATLCGSLDGHAVVAHAPVLVEGESAIVHMSRRNAFAPLVLNGGACTAVFHGPNHFVSSRWYENVTAPTWNYVIVQAEAGAMLPIEDEAEMKKVLMRLVKRQEDTIGDGFMPKLSAEYTDEMVKHIVMAQLVDVKWSGLFKLSQNKLESEQVRVMAELSRLGGAASSVSEAMKEERRMRGLES